MAPYKSVWLVLHEALALSAESVNSEFHDVSVLEVREPVTPAERAAVSAEDLEGFDEWKCAMANVNPGQDFGSGPGELDCDVRLPGDLSRLLLPWSHLIGRKGGLPM